MKRALLLSLLALVFLAAGGLAGSQTGFSDAEAHSERLAVDADRPVYGWSICADLGSALIPGVGVRQRFRVCQGGDWVILAYCLNTELPAPALGTTCSFVNATDLWCGEAVQLLREYALLQTPAPTATATRTATATATATATRTPTRTATLPPTSTLLPTSSLPPPSTRTQQAPTIVSRVTQVVPTRTRPGGPGNLEAVLLPVGVGGFSLLAAGVLAWRTFRHRKVGRGRDGRI